MEDHTSQPAADTSTRNQGAKSSSKKGEWQPPKLVFVEPALTKHGELTKVTGQFFGAFSPGAD